MKRHTKSIVRSQAMLFFFIGAGLLIAPLWAEKASAPQDKVEKKAEKKEDKKAKKKNGPKALHYEVTVTATRTKKDTFETPKPVSVVNRKRIEEKSPNNVTELLTDLPGVDMNGVGANQSRPVIRGFRGQRILLMQDGIRMNNSRRQQDFGEIPALVDVSEVDRLEVVRGPASVLYGSDAIGGVVNIITRIPDYEPGTDSVHGSLGYRFSSADKQSKGTVNVAGNMGRLGFMISGNYRKASEYDAPSGSFGEITLDREVRVNDTGVKDGGLNVLLSYNISKVCQLSFKYEYYHAEGSGFGFVDPELFEENPTRIRIRYPEQDVRKFSFKYEHREMDFLLADYVGLTVYHTSNERELAMDIQVPFSFPFPPGSEMVQESLNFTDVDTFGGRMELSKGLKNHTLTYGVDFYRDSSFNTDTSVTTVTMFGPPSVSTSNTPDLPNARYTSFGVFLQDDIALLKRTSLVLGIRYQNVNAKTRETPGLEDQPIVDSTDQTVVGAANLIWGVTDHLRLVFSVGRGFRSPNLIERFYHGATPEGGGFQSRNTELKAETSLNFDIGFKFRKDNVYLESTFFNNVIYDGIRVRPTGKMVDGFEEYRNENVDKLRMQGIEALGKVFLNFGLSVSANYTYIKSKDLGNRELPYSDTYSSKFNMNLRYDDPGKRFYIGYDLRVSGEQKDVDLGDNPVGPTIPGFTVHSASAGITLFRNSKHPMQIGIIVHNLADTLYAEFSNASFFRPAAGRHVVLTWSTKF